MRACCSCELLAVDPEDPPRYDVLNPDADPARPELVGPYCPSCWPSTVTGQINP